MDNQGKWEQPRRGLVLTEGCTKLSERSERGLRNLVGDWGTWGKLDTTPHKFLDIRSVCT